MTNKLSSRRIWIPRSFYNTFQKQLKVCAENKINTCSLSDFIQKIYHRDPSILSSLKSNSTVIERILSSPLSFKEKEKHLLFCCEQLGGNLFSPHEIYNTYKFSDLLSVPRGSGPLKIIDDPLSHFPYQNLALSILFKYPEFSHLIKKWDPSFDPYFQEMMDAPAHYDEQIISRFLAAKPPLDRFDICLSRFLYSQSLLEQMVQKGIGFQHKFTHSDLLKNFDNIGATEYCWEKNWSYRIERINLEEKDYGYQKDQEKINQREQFCQIIGRLFWISDQWELGHFKKKQKKFNKHIDWSDISDLSFLFGCSDIFEDIQKKKNIRSELSLPIKKPFLFSAAATYWGVEHGLDLNQHPHQNHISFQEFYKNKVYQILRSYPEKNIERNDLNHIFHFLLNISDLNENINEKKAPLFQKISQKYDHAEYNSKHLCDVRKRWVENVLEHSPYSAETWLIGCKNYPHQIINNMQILKERDQLLQTCLAQKKQSMLKENESKDFQPARKRKL